jgi:hypothetical protein
MKAMPDRPRTITVLIERNLISLKCIAASHERKLLLERAQTEFLHLGPDRLRVLDEAGHVPVSDLTDVALEEVEVLYSEGQRITIERPVRD